MPKIATLGRSVEEWIGSSPDAKIPDRVKLRVFERYEGRCYLTGVKILPGDAWEVEHRKPVEGGLGEHRESNLAPVLKAPHKEKTKREAAERAKARHVKMKSLGIGKSQSKLQSRPFPKFEKERKKPTKVLPPKPIFESE